MKKGWRTYQGGHRRTFVRNLKVWYESRRYVNVRGRIVPGGLMDGEDVMDGWMDGCRNRAEVATVKYMAVDV